MTREIDQSAQINVGAPIRASWWLLPLWSALGSAWAFSRSVLTDDPTSVAIAIALVAGGWQPLWHATTHTVWAVPLRRWKRWTETVPTSDWPYLEPETPGAVLHHRVALARSWWRTVGRDALAHPLRRALLGLLVSLLLGAALGREVLLLSLCFITLAELAALWHEGQGSVGTLWSGIALVGLPWLLGASLAGEGIRGAGSALVLTLTAGLYARNAWWSILGPVLGAAFLVLQGHPLTAGWLLLSGLPGLIVLTERPTDDLYESVAVLSLLAMITLTAAVL